MSYVPEWAKYYILSQDELQPSTVTIDFYQFDSGNVGLEPIINLQHDLAIRDVQQQIREKPLHSRIDGLHYDAVERPKHYQLLPGVEVRDVRQAILAKVSGATAGQLDDWSRAWEYLTRMWSKGEKLQDVKKAKKYLDWLIEELEQ